MSGGIGNRSHAEHAVFRSAPLSIGSGPPRHRRRWCRTCLLPACQGLSLLTLLAGTACWMPCMAWPVAEDARGWHAGWAAGAAITGQSRELSRHPIHTGTHMLHASPPRAAAAGRPAPARCAQQGAASTSLCNERAQGAGKLGEGHGSLSVAVHPCRHMCGQARCAAGPGCADIYQMQGGSRARVDAYKCASEHACPCAPLCTIGGHRGSSLRHASCFRAMGPWHGCHRTGRGGASCGSAKAGAAQTQTLTQQQALHRRQALLQLAPAHKQGAQHRAAGGCLLLQQA